MKIAFLSGCERGKGTNGKRPQTNEASVRMSVK